MVALSTQDMSDVNTLASFLAHSQIPSLQSCTPVDVIVLCGNAILPIAETVFEALDARPSLAKTLVICGGIGHSTQFLYEAVRSNKEYSDLTDQIDGLPEAAVFELILRRHHPRLGERIEMGEINLIIEKQSQNCGANAIKTRQVLELRAISTFQSCIVVQDPTMSLRTLAAFQHTYQDVSPAPQFFACPTFVPQVHLDERGEAHIAAEQHDGLASIDSAALWNNERFFDLVMGEIPRLRDDENGYGPKGKDFIVHVNVTAELETSWERLRNALSFKR